MQYLKSLFFNCLAVFLTLHIFPGIDVTDKTQVPHVGGDLFLAAGLGLLNSLIYPIVKMSGARLVVLRILFFALILNFSAYALVKILPLGITIGSFKGYAMAALAASVGSFLANIWEKKPISQAPPPPAEDPEIS